MIVTVVKAEAIEFIREHDGIGYHNTVLRLSGFSINSLVGYNLHKIQYYIIITI